MFTIIDFIPCFKTPVSTHCTTDCWNRYIKSLSALVFFIYRVSKSLLLLQLELLVSSRLFWLVLWVEQISITR